MSHFITLVFTKEDGKSVDELLAPYDENIEYAPYVKYTRQQAIDKVRREIDDYKNSLYAEYLKDKEAYKEKYKSESHIEYLENEFPKKLGWSDDECYHDVEKYWNENMIEPNGDLLSTYNPNSKWDWYEVGGRWSRYLKNKSGEYTDEDYASEIDWNDVVPFAFITTNGIWHEKAEMGWWAATFNEKKADEWEEEFMNYINSLDDDVIVTAVDCHI